MIFVTFVSTSLVHGPASAVLWRGSVVALGSAGIAGPALAPIWKGGTGDG